MRIVTQTGAGREMEHHQGGDVRPARRSGAKLPIPRSGAPRADGDQLDLIAPTPPSPTRRRTRAEVKAQFIADVYFGGDPRARDLLLPAAIAEERRAQRRRKGSP